MTELLPGLLQDALDALPIAKRMRSAASRTEFVRPVQWVVLMRDAEVIAAADERGIAMVFTGTRHFRH